MAGRGRNSEILRAEEKEDSFYKNFISSLKEFSTEELEKKITELLNEMTKNKFQHKVNIFSVDYKKQSESLNALAILKMEIESEYKE